MVTILIFGQTLRDSLKESEIQVEVATPMSFKALLEAHPDQLAGLRPFFEKGEILITINRKVASLDSSVRDGDTVKLTHQFNPTFEGAMWQNP